MNVEEISKRKLPLSKKRKQLIRAFKSFLNKDKYDLWITITFRNATNMEDAEKKVRYFFKYLNTKYTQYFEKFIRGWFFFEKDDDRNGVHVHAIVQRIPQVFMSEIEVKCNSSSELGNTVVKKMHDKVIPYLAFKYNTEKLEDFKPFKINSRPRLKHARDVLAQF